MFMNHFSSCFKFQPDGILLFSVLVPAVFATGDMYNQQITLKREKNESFSSNPDQSLIIGLE